LLLSHATSQLAIDAFQDSDRVTTRKLSAHPLG
jgi:hypothetical protein